MKTLTISKPASNVDSDSYRMNIHRGKYNEDRKHLGSLYLDYSMVDKNKPLFDKCTPQELIQLTEYISIFNKMRRCLGSQNKDIKVFGLHLDQHFPDILYEVAEAAKNAGIDFMPQDYIVDCLLNKVTEIGKQVDLSSIYQKYQFNPDYKQALRDTVSIDQRKRLVAAITSIEDEPGRIAQVFNDNLLEKYGKSKGFSYERLVELSAPDNPEKLKVYFLSNCVDTLQLYGINPCELLSPAMVFEYWLLPRISLYSLKKAIERFMLEFEVNEEYMDELITVATDLYSRPISANHVHIINT